MKSLPSIVAAASAFIMLIIFPDAARQSAEYGIKACGELIIPSLFPFFIAVNLTAELGLIGQFANSFKRGGTRLAAFALGITGGYPAGAAFVADIRKRGYIGKEEASRLLVCCNNSGPAFIIGAVGCGVFSSAFVGLILYGSHLLSAIIYGVFICRGKSHASTEMPNISCTAFSKAFTASVKNAVSSSINVCGFVIAFSVIIGMINAGGLISILCGRLSELFGTELHFNAALISGLLELGNGISCMKYLSPSPENIALAAFILGFGGLSVYFQTLSVISDTDIKTARYVIGRFMIAAAAAIISYVFATVFRI